MLYDPGGEDGTTVVIGACHRHTDGAHCGQELARLLVKRTELPSEDPCKSVDHLFAGELPSGVFGGISLSPNKSDQAMRVPKHTPVLLSAPKRYGQEGRTD